MKWGNSAALEKNFAQSENSRKSLNLLPWNQTIKTKDFFDNLVEFGVEYFHDSPRI